MARRSPSQLLRIRNKELKAARASIERLSVTRQYSLSFLRKAVAEAESARLGDLVRVPLPLRFNYHHGFSVEDVVLSDVHVLRDCD